jgi:hypothetical protein
LDELHHPLPQIQRISFHARKPIFLCPNVNMNCYSGDGRGGNCAIDSLYDYWP